MHFVCLANALLKEDEKVHETIGLTFLLVTLPNRLYSPSIADTSDSVKYFDVNDVHGGLPGGIKLEVRTIVLLSPAFM